VGVVVVGIAQESRRVEMGELVAKCQSCGSTEYLYEVQPVGWLPQFMCEDCRHNEGVDVLALLDDATGRVWESWHTGGNCYALSVQSVDRAGDYVMVTGEDVLSRFGDLCDFGSAVKVGYYPDEDSCEAQFLVVREFGRRVTVGDVVQVVADAFDEWGIKRS